MKNLALLLLLLLPSVSFGQRAIEVSLPDGRKAVLKPDKTWDYVRPPAKAGGSKAGDTQLLVEPLGALVALMKKTPAVFTRGETETETEADYFSKLNTYFDKTILKGKKLKDTFFMLPTDFDYQIEKDELIAFVGFLDDKYNLVSRTNGVYGSETRILKLKLPFFDAREVKPFLRVAVNALPVEIDKSGSVRLLPVKYVIYDDRDMKIFETITTQNELSPPN